VPALRLLGILPMSFELETFKNSLMATVSNYDEIASIST
jgi:hypothetical protein